MLTVLSGVPPSFSPSGECLSGLTPLQSEKFSALHFYILGFLGIDLLGNSSVISEANLLVIFPFWEYLFFFLIYLFVYFRCSKSRLSHTGKTLRQ